MSTFANGTAVAVSRDDRRVIEEFDGPNFSVQLFEILGDAGPLGRHHHQNKFEVFTILEGGGEVLLCPVDEEGNATGEVVLVALSAGSVVRVNPGLAHTFYLEVGTRMHCFSSMPFDKRDLCPAPWLVRHSPPA